MTIRPMTRLEGHGRIAVFLDEHGDVENAYVQVVEFRGFERFCQGRPVEEMLLITPRICGVCPWAHHMASAKATDALYDVRAPDTARKLRELACNASYVHDHSAVFYFLSAPDFVVGTHAPRAERNVLGMANKLGADVVKGLFRTRRLASRILEVLGGRSVHPTFCLPGGVSRALTEEERRKMERYAKELVEFGQSTLRFLEQAVLTNEDYVRLVADEACRHQTYYMSVVGDDGKADYYDGDLKIVEPGGKDFLRFSPEMYFDHIAEHVEDWSYLKFPFLKDVGWKGLVDGRQSGIYRVGPLARLNTCAGFATPLADDAYRNLVSILGKPVHATFAYHWARVLEILNAAERVLELTVDREITRIDVRNMPEETPQEGVGVVEAPRGTLIHHYRTDGEGLLTGVNLVVATTHNNAGISMSVKQLAQRFIRRGVVDDGLLNMVEMAYRAYDPCLACGTHLLPGSGDIQVDLYRDDGALMKTIRR